MIHIVGLILRAGVVLFAFLLVYIALFMYKDERGKLQNRLDELWVRVDDSQRAALKRHTVFLKEFLRLVNLGVDSLLGGKLFSLRAIFVTICYSTASYAMVIFLIFAAPSDSFVFGHDNFDFKLLFMGIIVFWGFIILGTSALAIGRTRLSSSAWTWLAGIVLAILGIVATLLWAMHTLLGTQKLGLQVFIATLPLVVPILGGPVCDILFVATNRAMIRTSVRLNTTLQIIAMMLANVIIVALYTGPLVWIDSTDDIRAMASAIAATNVITGLSALGIVAVMVVALGHRLFWPFVARPIYAIADNHLTNKPALLLSVAFVLLTSAIPAWQPILTKLKEIK